MSVAFTDMTEFSAFSYRCAVGSAAVESRGDVSDVDDLDATACLWVQTVAIEVPDTSEDLMDGGGVVTDDVGRLRHVVTIPGNRKSHRTLSK